MKDISFGITYFPFGSLDDLKAITNLDEDIDYDCIFIVARNPSCKIMGVAGVNLKRHKYPRFEHIIIHPSMRKTKLAYTLMQKIEEYLIKIDKENYVSYILNNNNLMQHYAEKWGMKEYSKTDKGKWYYKTLPIIKNEERVYEYA